MPGANARALEKARTLDADSLILDLEDAVAPDAKVDARAQISAAVSAGGYGHREVIVRVNGLASAWGADDVAAIAGLPLDGVCFPKIERAEEVIAAVDALDAAGGRADLPIWAMIETPRGVLNAASIASAHPRLAGLVMGTSDLAKELRAQHTADRAPFVYALSHCVLAARAAGIAILDGVHLKLDDGDEFLAHCEQGRALGFDGKTLIHPRQLDAANRVFAPDAAAVAQAQAILDAWAAARAEGRGLCVVDGKLVENLHVEEAQHTLDMHAAIQRAR
jgi:citrate lyase subunit beta/citryl-CoA lyase